MNREILFRGKRMDIGMWEYGNLSMRDESGKAKYYIGQNMLGYEAVPILETIETYEDTGLEPYHIPDVLTDCHKLVEECRKLKVKNSRLKRLLKLAVDDLNKLAANAVIKYRYDIFITKKIGIDGACGSISRDEWRYADEAKELIKRK